MLGVALSWLAIIIVFLSLGDFFVFTYKKVYCGDEKYSFSETFVLGLCFATVVTSITSIWFPTNLNTLGIYILASITYWLLRRDRLFSLLCQAKDKLTKIPTYQFLFFLLPILGLALLILRQAGVIDSLYYHQQNIIWNENYAAVPGLGNLEDRFAFNSNYMLLSALFSLRAIFGEGVYGLQALLAVVLICQITGEILKSGFELKRIILLFIFLLFIFTFSYTLAATSTDAIPNILSFYLITRLCLYPGILKDKTLLVFSIPILLVTFKITTIPLCLLSLAILVMFVKQKNYCVIIYLCCMAMFVILPWLVRNIIISGYLIFPIYQIDLFSFDWKMPVYVLQKEHEFITYCGNLVWDGLLDMLSNPIFEIDSFYNIFVASFYLGFTILSPFIAIYTIIKKKITYPTLLAYIAALLVVVIWYVGGPDPRFIGGVLFAIPFFCIVFLLPSRDIYLAKRTGILFLSIASLFPFLWASNRTIKLYDELKSSANIEKTQRASTIFIKPISYKEQTRAKGIDVDNYTPYTLNNNIVIYMSKSGINGGIEYTLYDRFPAAVFHTDNIAKFQPIQDIEARGNSLQDGFRPKK